MFGHFQMRNPFYFSSLEKLASLASKHVRNRFVYGPYRIRSLKIEYVLLDAERLGMGALMLPLLMMASTQC